MTLFEEVYLIQSLGLLEYQSINCWLNLNLVKSIIGWINPRDNQVVKVNGTRYLFDQGPIVEYFTPNVMSFTKSKRTIGLMIWKVFFSKVREAPSPSPRIAIINKKIYKQLFSPLPPPPPNPLFVCVSLHYNSSA